MGKTTFLVFALALLISNQLSSQTQIHHTLHFVADSLSFKTVSVDSLTFIKVNYANEYEKICDTGNPELPVIVNRRIRFGDLEFDTMIGRNHQGAILTINDRTTGMCWLSKLSGKESEPLKEAAVRELAPWEGLIHTITADNGKEFAAHQEIAEALNANFYFAHPYHSWKRGSNENMNGLIRQYIPKGSSFENLSNEYIKLIQNKLNNRPRKKSDICLRLNILLLTLLPTLN